MTTAMNGSTLSMPWCPKSASVTTMPWQSTVKRTTLEKPVNDSTALLTAIPASSACTQLHPMSTARLSKAGNVPPRTPNEARVRTIVGSPVRVPMQPTSASADTPSSVPRTMIRIACGYRIPGTNNVPVSRVVTTMFAASQTMMVFPNPIVRSVSAPGSTVSWPNRATMRCSMRLSLRMPAGRETYTRRRNLRSTPSGSRAGRGFVGAPPFGRPTGGLPGGGLLLHPRPDAGDGGAAGDPIVGGELRVGVLQDVEPLGRALYSLVGPAQPPLPIVLGPRTRDPLLVGPRLVDALGQLHVALVVVQVAVVEDAEHLDRGSPRRPHLTRERTARLDVVVGMRALHRPARRLAFVGGLPGPRRSGLGQARRRPGPLDLLRLLGSCVIRTLARPRRLLRRAGRLILP